MKTRILDIILFFKIIESYFVFELIFFRFIYENKLKFGMLCKLIVNSEIKQRLKK